MPQLKCYPGVHELAENYITIKLAFLCGHSYPATGMLATNAVLNVTLVQNCCGFAKFCGRDLQGDLAINWCQLVNGIGLVLFQKSTELVLKSWSDSNWQAWGKLLFFSCFTDSHHCCQLRDLSSIIEESDLKEPDFPAQSGMEDSAQSYICTSFDGPVGSL